jgi:hypothetical protein
MFFLPSQCNNSEFIHDPILQISNPDGSNLTKVADGSLLTVIDNR